MKKITLSILGMMLAFAGFAKVVSVKEASDIALLLMAEKGVNAQSVVSVSPVDYQGSTAFYGVSFAPEGWALISADDVITPLVGYSDKGAFPAADMPSNMRGWLNLNAEQILDYKKEVNTRSTDWDKNKISRSSAPSMALTDKISPLIKVQWNQTNPYNKYCPSTSSAGRAVVGCVAVAMAQAMSVVKYPARPQGMVSYDSGSPYGTINLNYDNEAPYNWADIISGENNRDEAARLLWHCGPAVSMSYGPAGSGTYTNLVSAALKKHFGYPKSVTYIKRDNYNDKDWNALILNELKEGRAVIYHGYPADGTAGHCFDLDGYDGVFYHVNWGWGGAGDGYFSLDKLAAQVVVGGAVMSFTQGHGMVIGVRAPSTKPTNITLSNTSVVEKQPAGTVVGAITVESDFDNVTYSYLVQGKQTFFGYAQAPFEVKDGNLVTTEPISAADYADVVTGNSFCNITITATNANGEAVSRQFNISIKASSAIDEVMNDEIAPVEYYNMQGVKVENPTNGVYIKKQGNSVSKVILK